MLRSMPMIALACLALTGCGQDGPSEPSPERTARAFIDAITTEDCAALMNAYHPDLRAADCTPDAIWLALAGVASALATELDNGAVFEHMPPPAGFTLGEEIASVDYPCGPTETCTFVTVLFEQNWYIGELN